MFQLLLYALLIASLIISVTYALLYLYAARMKSFQNPLYKFDHSIISIQSIGSQKYEVLRIPGSDQSIKIIFLTGNPSSVMYYERFLRSLHLHTHGKYEILSTTQSGQFTYKGKGILSYTSLQYEIAHKRAFIEQVLQSNSKCKIVLLGHSIGGYMTLQLLDQLPRDRIQKAVLLFPALERLTETPNGKMTWYTVYTPFRQICSVIGAALGFLPDPILRFLICAYWPEITGLKRHSGGSEHLRGDLIEGTMKYLKYTNFINLLYMTYFEYRDIKTLQVDALRRNSDLLQLYYARTDKWAPIKFYNELRARLPNLQVELDDLSFEHAFVVNDDAQQQKLIERIVHWCNLPL